MRNYRIILIAAAFVAALSSCSQKVRIDGKLAGAPDSEIVVKCLSGSTMEVLDTIKTDSEGKYSYALEVAEGQPEFVYIFSGDTKVASLLLKHGDKVKVESDASGRYTVEGSEESSKLGAVEEEFAAFMKDFTAAVESGDGSEASREYIKYYRSRIRYVLDNSKSLTAIPVLYQKINEDFPVFSQSTDAVLFQNVHDSLKLVYPASKYVAALGREAERRSNILSLEQRIKGASESAFPEIELPDIDGRKVRLSDISKDAKLVLIHFWTASDASQKMFNQDVLVPLYKTYHPKGLEIYSVSLDTDKGVWASAVKSQGLPWTNVCDGRGVATPSVALYNISKALPVIYALENETLAPDVISTDADLRKLLASRLK